MHMQFNCNKELRWCHLRQDLDAPMQGNARRCTFRGFTLIELMVVMVILAILVSLVSVAVVNAISQARQTAVKTEIDALDQAMRQFKLKFGTCPPNFADPAVLQRAWSHMFSRSQDQPPKNLDAAQSLVFWLSGFSPRPDSSDYRCWST